MTLVQSALFPSSMAASFAKERRIALSHGGRQATGGAGLQAGSLILLDSLVLLESARYSRGLMGKVRLVAETIWRWLTHRFAWVNDKPGAAAFWLSLIIAGAGAYKFFIENHVTVAIEGGYTSNQNQDALPPEKRAAPVDLRLTFSNSGLLPTAITRLTLEVQDWGQGQREILHEADLPVLLPGRSSARRDIRLWVKTTQPITIVARDLDGREHRAAVSPTMITYALVMPGPSRTIHFISDPQKPTPLCGDVRPANGWMSYTADPKQVTCRACLDELNGVAKRPKGEP